MDAMRAMLDELMGKERNVPLEERSQRAISWDDPSVCKYQLVGVCPSRLFKNTKSDLGPCEFELHDDHLEWENIKKDFERVSSRDRERLERRLMRYLEDLIRDMDRKITRNKERAEKESAPRELRPEDQVKLTEIQSRAKDALEKAERLAEEGEVDQAMLLQQQAETYNKQHDELHRKMTIPEKTMLVCDVCGVFINSTDNDQRRRDHLEGKQFLGWKAIRERYGELLEQYGPGGGSAPVGSTRGVGAAVPRATSVDREREREMERDRDRDRGRERERERERDRRGMDRDRDRERAREREYRSSSKDYDRNRSRNYSRDRDRDRDRREYYDRRRY